VLGVEKWAVFFYALNNTKVFFYSNLASHLSSFCSLNERIFCQISTGETNHRSCASGRNSLCDWRCIADSEYEMVDYGHVVGGRMAIAIIQDVPPIDIRNKSKVKRGPSASQLVN
jgi:hypothetical protein